MPHFGLPSYLLHSWILALVTAPLIYLGVIHFILLDIFLALYQGIHFRIYNIQKVDYLIFDRGKMFEPARSFELRLFLPI